MAVRLGDHGYAQRQHQRLRRGCCTSCRVGVAVAAGGRFRFIAADPDFSTLDGSSFHHLVQLEQQLARLARTLAPPPLQTRGTSGRVRALPPRSGSEADAATPVCPSQALVLAAGAPDRSSRPARAGRHQPGQIGAAKRTRVLALATVMQTAENSDAAQFVRAVLQAGGFFDRITHVGSLTGRDRCPLARQPVSTARRRRPGRREYPARFECRLLEP